MNIQMALSFRSTTKVIAKNNSKNFSFVHTRAIFQSKKTKKYEFDYVSLDEIFSVQLAIFALNINYAKFVTIRFISAH